MSLEINRKCCNEWKVKKNNNIPGIKICAILFVECTYFKKIKCWKIVGCCVPSFCPQFNHSNLWMYTMEIRKPTMQIHWGNYQQNIWCIRHSVTLRLSIYTNAGSQENRFTHDISLIITPSSFSVLRHARFSILMLPLQNIIWTFILRVLGIILITHPDE